MASVSTATNDAKSAVSRITVIEQAPLFFTSPEIIEHNSVDTGSCLWLQGHPIECNGEMFQAKQPSHHQLRSMSVQTDVDQKIIFEMRSTSSNIAYQATNC